MTVSVDTTQRIQMLEGSNHTRTAVLTSNAWVYSFFKTIIFSVCVFVCVCLWTCVCECKCPQRPEEDIRFTWKLGTTWHGCWETGLRSSVEAKSTVLKFALSMAVHGVACFPPPLATLNIITVLFMPICLVDKSGLQFLFTDYKRRQKYPSLYFSVICVFSF